MSHNNSYASSALSSVATISGDTGNTLSGAKYSDVFVESSYSGALDSCGQSCLINCSCASGWSSTNSWGDNAIKVTSNRTYYNGNSSPSQVTCYKENQSFYVTAVGLNNPYVKCDGTYSVDITVDYSDGTWETFTETEDVCTCDSTPNCVCEYCLYGAGKDGKDVCGYSSGDAACGNGSGGGSGNTGGSGSGDNSYYSLDCSISDDMSSIGYGCGNSYTPTMVSCSFFDEHGGTTAPRDMTFTFTYSGKSGLSVFESRYDECNNALGSPTSKTFTLKKGASSVDLKFANCIANCGDYWSGSYTITGPSDVSIHPKSGSFY